MSPSVLPPKKAQRTDPTDPPLLTASQQPRLLDGGLGQTHRLLRVLDSLASDLDVEESSLAGLAALAAKITYLCCYLVVFL